MKPRSAALGGGLLIAALLVLPGLGSFGFWAPGELRVAERAWALAQGEVAPGLALFQSAWLPALGFAVFGESEFAARLPGAVVALATLVAVFCAGRAAYGHRAGLIAAVAFAAFPAFVLEARQLTSDLPTMLGITLAIWGFARQNQAPRRAIAFGLFGLVLAVLSGGLLVGALPILVAATVALAWQGGRPRATLALIVGVATIFAVLLIPAPAGVPSFALGGTPAVPTARLDFDAGIERLGFALFPLGALAAVAIFAEAGRDGTGERRLPPPFLLVFVVAGLAAATLQLHLIGEARLVVLPAFALGLAAWLNEAIARGERADLVGFVFMAGALLLTRDVHLSPEALVSVHQPGRIAWPVQLSLSALVRGVGFVSACGLALLTFQPAWLRQSQRGPYLAVALVLAPALVLDGALAHVFVPKLAQHLSAKSILGSFHRLAPPGATLGLYRVEEREIGILRRPPLRRFSYTADLVRAVAEDPSFFALIPRHDLAALEVAFTEAAVPYAVADAGSSQHLLITSRAPAGRDENPLREIVWHPSLAGIPAFAAGAPAAVFADAIELVGVERPNAVQRSHGLPLTLTFRVRARPPAGYKIFVHVERTGPIITGDHAPAEGLFGTEHWRPGHLIRDRVHVNLPALTTAPGTYRVFAGFWPGGDTPVRLPITSGRSDGRNRTPLGPLEIQ